MNILYRLSDYLNLPTHTALGISLPVWIKLLWKNKFAVDVQYWPKALFITTTVLLNVPFQLWEYFRYSKSIRQTKVNPPVFILGHPRSGPPFFIMLSRDLFCFCSLRRPDAERFQQRQGWNEFPHGCYAGNPAAG
jgi:hypothetical protein